MIDIKEVIQNQKDMETNVAARNVSVDVASIIGLYKDAQEKNATLQAYQEASNEVAKQLKRVTETQAREQLVEQGRTLRGQISDAKATYNEASTAFSEAALVLPNWMSPDVPVGSSDADNKEISKFGEPTKFDFRPKDHVELGETLDLIDFKSGAKVAGSKFYFLKNEAVLLQHAIKTFVFRKAIENGFTCLHTPDIARNSVLRGIGFAPRGDESNTYEIEGMDMSLVATAEIAVGGMHADELIPYDHLPLLYVAESHCFRREGGTAGRASKGLYRVHQFEKIELFAFSTPEQSPKIHDQILALEEDIYRALGLPYRVVVNCSGDLGAPAYKKYDIEAWMPGKGENGEYGEVTSASNCTSYQARRLNIRYKDPVTGKNAFVHTLNGTAVALSRTPVAIMENYQTKEGGIRIPPVLVPFLGFDYIQPRGNVPRQRMTFAPQITG